MTKTIIAWAEDTGPISVSVPDDATPDEQVTAANDAIQTARQAQKGGK